MFIYLDVTVGQWWESSNMLSRIWVLFIELELHLHDVVLNAFGIVSFCSEVI